MTPERLAPLPHALSIDEVSAWLGTDPTRGLTSAEVARRLQELGANRPAHVPRPGYARIAGRQLADPLVALLLVAAVISALIGERIEAAVIGAIVFLNALLGFVQEAGAERAVLALGEAVQHSTVVVRDGTERLVDTEEIVPGDVAVLREGDRVPADARVVDGGLELDESALTGESAPVPKTSTQCAADTPLADRASMVFQGTAVTRGRGRVLVVATGDATEIGRVARLTAEARPPATPLQLRIAQLANVMVVLGVAVTVALTVGMLARGESLDEAFLVGVAVAVAAVPEGLAATMTIALARGARAMAAQGALVRRLIAVETLGGATVIAADKTGTLTVNRLSVSAVHPLPGRTEEDVIRAGALASTADLVEEPGGGRRIVGDPVDGALLMAAAETIGADPRTAPGRRLVREVPFDPRRRRLTALYEEADGLQRVVVKGALESLAERADVTAAELKALEDAAQAWAADGLRVLAVGERVARGPAEEGDDLDRGIVLLGLVALHDPLRPNAAESIRAARAAGVEVAILTGDHPATAGAIARALELDERLVVTGAELDRMDAEGLAAAVRSCSVFARVTPEHKLRIVESLQEAGHVVVVTGDGVNDAPALRRAHLGVAMGESGTEAAREAAEVVLTNDDFATIVAAIAEGRRIDDNVRKFVAFLLSANLGEVVLFGIAVMAGLGAPMTIVQLLTVNLLTDGLPAVALAGDAASGSVLERGPRRDKALFSRAVWAVLGLAGVGVGLAATAAYLAGRALEPDAAQTMAFATIALAELVLVWSIRTQSAPAWTGSRNNLLTTSVVLSAAIVAALLYVPPLASLFGTQPLEASALLVVLALSVLPAALLEAGKHLRATAAPPQAGVRGSGSAETARQ
ncbi:MAG TPA: cation-transporting P-type ATPase [Gaiella sp.]